MIIFSGFGFLVLIFGIGAAFVMTAATRGIGGDPAYWANHGWPKLVAGLMAGALTYVVGRYLNKRTSKVLMDPDTMQSVNVGARHSMFFIPMEYWGVILVILGVVAMFVEKSPPAVTP